MFDEYLRNVAMQSVYEERGYDESVEPFPDAKARLLHKCERAKIDLSFRESVEIYVDSFFRGVQEDDLHYSLSRERLQEVVMPLLLRGIGRIKKLLNSVDVSPAQISLCVATGGMANMPIIKSRLHELFGARRVYIPESGNTLISEGAAWIAHDRTALKLAKNIELLLARNSYMTLVPSGASMPNEGDALQREYHLYCSDPRDGHAKFQLHSPFKVGEHALPNDLRSPLGTMIVPVDSNSRPFHERLELDIQIDDNLILKAQGRALNTEQMDRCEVHNLEFSLDLPLGAPQSRGFALNISSEDSSICNYPGDLVIRSNITSSKDDSLVPGELLYSYNRGYFDQRQSPPPVQDRERLYYTPCVVCGRISNDPLCQCDKFIN